MIHLLLCIMNSLWCGTGCGTLRRRAESYLNNRETRHMQHTRKVRDAQNHRRLLVGVSPVHSLACAGGYQLGSSEGNARTRYAVATVESRLGSFLTVLLSDPPRSFVVSSFRAVIIFRYKSARRWFPPPRRSNRVTYFFPAER